MSGTSTRLTARAARRADAAAITEIYNEGIADRVGAFEAEPRAPGLRSTTRLCGSG